jgi:hypothetical protein
MTTNGDTDSPSSCGVPLSLLEKVAGRLEFELLSDLLIRKLGKQGIGVTTRQRTRLTKWLEQGAKGEVPLPQAKRVADDVKLTFTSRDERRLKGRLLREMAGIVAEVTHTAAERMARPALRDTQRELLQAARREARAVRGFEKRLARTWNGPIELLEVQRHLACGLGAEINEELRRHFKRSEEPLVDVLTSLHARACQIAGEVLVLLRSGYAEGAIARWRSLHEASVVLQFIDRHGVETAKCYLEHEAIESWKGATEYVAHCGRLGFESIDDKELPRIKAAHDAAVEKYGAPFRSSYGWAAHALKLEKRVTFEDVEKGLGLEHWRPFYRLASHPIHANPKSVRHRLGLIDGTSPCLPAGPSNYGLADPGQNTGLSLAQATSVLIARANPTPGRLLAMFVMRELAAKIARAFVAVQRRMEQRDARLRAREKLAKEKTP